VCVCTLYIRSNENSQQHQSTDRDPATNHCKEACKDKRINKRVFEHENKMKMPKPITSNKILLKSE